MGCDRLYGITIWQSGVVIRVIKALLITRRRSKAGKKNEIGSEGVGEKPSVVNLYL